MLRIILPLTIALIAHTAMAQESSEKLKGLLWEVSGNGIAKNGYLYGTMHVPEKLAFNLSDSFFIALRAVDMVALETDHDRWQEFTEMLQGQESILYNPGYGGYDGGQNYAQPNLYQAQFQFSPPGNELLGAMLSAKPRMTNEFLYRSNQYRQDHEEDTYLDLFIFQAGRKLGKTVIGLETLEGSYEAMVRAQFPDDDDEKPERYYGGMHSRQTLEDAYRDQDLSLMDSLNKLSQPSKNFQRWMLDERNLIMVNGIDSILKSGTALFSAVGAAHLPGESGLIKQLRDRGYTLRPVQFTSEHFKSEKEAIETLRYPVQFSRQWATDSTWSVEAPSKFYQTVDGMGLEQQLCTDMSNGAYYAVYRVHTYGMWNGQSPAYIAERIDSMLYEKIPGKIQERIRLNEPFPGHQITTRTRRGDIVRYKIFATPMEIFVFATGGNGDYAAGAEGSRFINSVQFHRQKIAGASQSTTIQPSYGGFKVELPAPPVINTTLDKKADRYLVATVDPADSAFYMVYRASYHDWKYIEEDSFELNVIGENIAEQFTKSTPQSTLVATAPYPIQDVSFRSDRDSAHYYLRLFINGPHYFLLACRKTTAGAPTGFFNSFSVKPFKYPQGWETLRDTNLQFEATVPMASLKPPVPFVEKLQRIIEEGFKKSKRNEGGYYDGPERRLFRQLKAPLQDEVVSIYSYTLQKSGYINTLDSFQSYISKLVSDRGKMTIQKQSWEQPNDSLLVGHFLMEDTNSTRGIRSKVMLTPGRMYMLSATVQLGQPNSAFVDKIFGSFTPTDTTQGVLSFGERDLRFLKEIYSADSLVREKALFQLQDIWISDFSDTNFPQFRAAIEHPQFANLEYKYRNLLLRSLRNFKTADALQYVLSLSEHYPDSLRYQQTLMVVLAEMKTRPAQEALISRLKQEKVYVSGGTITNIFDSLSDSLELAIRNLSDLVALSEQAEYQEAVADLLADAIDQNLVKPKSYRRMKTHLLRETRRGLGGQQFKAEIKRNKDDGDSYLSYDYGYYPSGNEYSATNLERNLSLLAPFIHKDHRVEDIFDLAAKSPEKETQVMAMSLLLQQHQPVRQKTLQAFAENDRTRYMLYRHLVDVGQLAPYSAWFSDTVALVRSVLFEELNRRNDYDDAKETDSIRFVSQHRTVLHNEPALVFFFDVKKKKEKDWTLALVNMPLSSNLFGITANSKRNSYDSYYWQRPQVRILSQLPENEKAEFIQKTIGEIRFANRERYRSWGGGSSDYYYEE